MAERTSLAQIRRELHAHPEPGWAEFATTARLLEELSGLPGVRVVSGSGLRLGERLGVDEELQELFARRAVDAGVDEGLVRELLLSGTGLVCEIGDDDPARVVALRVDVDALAVAESADGSHAPAREGFRSRFEGWSHACGHDGHAAIGVGIVRALSGRAAEIPPGSAVRVVFQPAEEGTRGGRAFVEAGWLDDADAFFALHLDGELGHPAGAVVPGAVEILATRKIDIEATGRSAHSSGSPEQGIDALAAAVELYTELTGLSAPGRSVACNVLRGGSARNAIADRAVLLCEVRAADDRVAAGLAEEVESAAAAVARRTGALIEPRTVGASSGGASDARGIAVVEGAAAACGLGLLPVRALRASDDASDMLARVQSRGGFGSYALVSGGIDALAHSAAFDVADAALDAAVALMVACALATARKESE